VVQITDDFTFRPHDRSGRHTQFKIGAILSVLLARGAVSTSFGKELPSMAKRTQPVHRSISNEDHTATASSITAVRTAARDVFLAVEADQPVSTVAASNVNLSAIYQTWKPSCEDRDHYRDVAFRCSVDFESKNGRETLVSTGSMSICKVMPVSPS
jgi:hypothetical protein